MGLYIYSTVNFDDKISSAVWGKTWKETLYLLDNFPTPLVRLRKEKEAGHERLVYTSQLVAHEDTDEMHWHVVGDAISKQRAESFILYKNIKQYRSDFSKSEKEKDVLWAEEEKLHYINCNGYRVFNAKTQGRPYHLAMLAVGMLLENRFPKNACVNGDIELVQAEKIKIWLEEQFDEDFELPVCLDADRLWKRLVDAYPKKKNQAIERFSTLFRGSEEEELESLFRLAGQSATLKHWASYLSQYEDLGRFGVSNLVRTLTNVTGDIRLVIETILMVKETEKKSKFDLKSLLKKYCQSFITIKFSEREILRNLYQPLEGLKTIDHVFGQLFSLMGGMSNEINFYLSENDLLELFLEYEPNKRNVFKKVIKEGTERYLKQIKEVDDLMEKINDKIEAADEDKNQEEENLISYYPTLPVRSFTEVEKYILKETLAQREPFKGIENHIKAFSKQLHKKIESDSDDPSSVFSIDKKDKIRYMIWDATRRSGFGLHEAAWKKIDGLKDKMTLKCLLGLAAIVNDELNFWKFRLYVMETPELWEYFKKEQQKLKTKKKSK